MKPDESDSDGTVCAEEEEDYLRSVCARRAIPAQDGQEMADVQPEGGAPSPEAATDELTCKICFASRVDCLLLDCAHVMCYGCARFVKVCPFCRKVVRKRKKIRAGPA
eukprot:TRINITY_DN11149_c0_g1_i4.p3 TRINITY_DN11149_c0_g1~~TRINITY_DN11149_c0_g1_i4.p3  ORF type:complete len:108 (+),score=35.19 TRINITY_DN11149_c0_g1_i4:524-847(+)